METTTAWPRQDIVLVPTPPERYNTILATLLAALVGRYGSGVVVTANRPVHVLRSTLDAAGVDRSTLRFVDCISGLTGFIPPNEPDAVYIDSPTMMEKTGLRAEQLLRRLPEGQRFLLVDSLSTLAVYNGRHAVAEMVHNLSTRMRLLGVGTVLLLVEGNAEGLEQDVGAHCDRIHRPPP